jgi:hypothetical protein
MKKLFSFRLILSFLPGLVASAVLFVSAPLYAQGDYDLQMTGIESSFATLQSGCMNQIKPHFAIVGTDDHYVPSGGTKVHLQYHTNTQLSWTDIGDLTVTHTAGDGDFVTGSAWPDEYPSVSNGFANENSLEFSLPAGVTQVAVRASVNYVPNQTDPNNNAIVDTTPGDNALETSFVAAAPATCTIKPPVLDICKLHPAICHPIECQGPGCIIIKFDPETCPQCGVGPIEVITSLPPDYVLVAYTKAGREVARSTQLARSGAGASKQRLAFDSKKGESYSFKVISVKGIKGKFDKALIKPDIQIRTTAPMRSVDSIRTLPAGAIIK